MTPFDFNISVTVEAIFEDNKYVSSLEDGLNFKLSKKFVSVISGFIEVIPTPLFLTSSNKLREKSLSPLFVAV